MSKNRTRIALIVGRALHPPWNEGTRVIGRNLGEVVSQLRPAQVVSLSHVKFKSEKYLQDGEHGPIRHIYTELEYSKKGDYLGLPKAMRALRGIFDSHHVAVTHLIGFPLVLAPWLQRRGSKVVAHVVLSGHVYIGQADHLRARLAHLLDRWIDAYACTSECIIEDLAKQGYTKEKLQLVRPPINVNLYKPMDRTVARRRFSLESRSFVVIYIGTVSPLRFPAKMILAALREASSQIPNLELHVFAPVVTHEYNLVWAEQNIRDHTYSSGLVTKVQLRDLDEENKAALYSAANLVLLPFSAPVAVEPPLTLIEAMSCGALVAAAPHANRSSVVRNGVNGLTFSSKEELIDCLLYAHKCEDNNLDVLRQQARQTVVDNYSYSAVSSAVRDVWTALSLPDDADVSNRS